MKTYPKTVNIWNYRLGRAIAAHRIAPTAETLTEIREAMRQRACLRSARLQSWERAMLAQNYLKAELYGFNPNLKSTSLG